MKKFLVSALIGSFVGVALAFLFLFVRVKFADGISDFLTREREANAPIGEIIKNPFGPRDDRYRIEAGDVSVPMQGKALLANLEKMSITMYQDGQVVGEYPIASVGREGTAWQTPVGQFEMSYKKENHFSSIGHVWMPYSMHFFGNYFIHGWPYYPDGTPVAKGYSGGCIRMETVDAEQVFGFVDTDTALLVVKSDEDIAALPHFEYEIAKDVPQVSAQSFLVADLESGEVVASKNQNLSGAADFAKLMTAIISLEGINQYNAVTFGGQSMTVGDVLYALILADSDEAADLLHSRRNDRQYIVDMNDRAASIGMNNTTYDDVNENESSQSTPEDTFRLVQYIKLYKPFLFKALGKETYEKGDVTFESAHPLAGMDEYVSGFANTDNRSQLSVVSVTLPGDSREREFLILVQGSDDARAESERLIGWVRENVRFDK